MIYDTPTQQFNPKTEVAALFIEFEGRILLLHRHEDKLQGNRWGIPGGKLEPGETPLQAVIREVEEETAYRFSEEMVTHVKTVYVERDSQDHFVFHMFRAQLTERPDKVKIDFYDHKGFTWVTPADSLKLNLVQDASYCFKIIYNL